MRLSTSVFLACYLLSSWAAADIFKCRDAKGDEKYQNFPCPIDSIGSKATAPPPTEPAKQAEKTAAAAAPAAPPGEKPQPGMKMNSVRAAWGVPRATTVAKGVETWFYDGPAGTTQGVVFDRTGTVQSVAEMELPEAEAD